MHTIRFATALQALGFAACAAIFAGSPARAQTSTAAPPKTAATPAELAQAEVRRVDKESRKITLKHGPIRNLDMPPMTMVFQVDDARLLDRVKSGDKVRFSAVHENGRYVVTDIQAAGR